MQRVIRRATEEQHRYLSRAARRPSFTYKSLEAARVRAAMKKLGVKDPAYLVDGKDDAQQWATSLGLRVPVPLGTYARAADVPWAALPQRCVIKPCRGSTSAGVYLLRRQDDRWLELRTGVALTAEDVVAELGALADRGAVSPGVLVEELITDAQRTEGPPTDYKVSTFFGEVGLIETKGHGWDAQGRPTVLWRIFSPQWEDLKNPFSDHGYDTDGIVPPPMHPEALLDTARKVSAAVPRPFLRVDLFDDVDGPVFGETTPEPGGSLTVRPDVDRALGELWEQAEVRLRIRAAEAGLLTPVGAPAPEGSGTAS